ncbi:MAG: N-acetyltransferase [Chitinophagaceae bacterium]|nr:MAG: N-acetyltransferase [Chitinophagaceae bacterium]
MADLVLCSRNRSDRLLDDPPLLPLSTTVTIAETPRLLLRQLGKSDAAFIYRLVNTEGWLKNIGDRNVHSVENAEAYIERTAIASYKANGFGLWMVESKDNHEPMGICGLIRRPGLEDVDIGFAFMPGFHGKGFAIEAAAATVQQAARVGLRKLVAITLPANKPSVNLLLRLRFRFEKTMTLPGETVPLNLYSLDIKS